MRSAKRIEASAARARENCSEYVVIGIGGSYLGARAVLEAVPQATHERAARAVVLGQGLDGLEIGVELPLFCLDLPDLRLRCSQLPGDVGLGTQYRATGSQRRFDRS